jgi:hypothetical protein
MIRAIALATLSAAATTSLAQSGLDLNNSQGFGSGAYFAGATFGNTSTSDSDFFDGFFSTSGGGLFDAATQFAEGGTSGGINDLVSVTAEAFVSLQGRSDDGSGNISLAEGARLSINLRAYGFADGFGTFLTSDGQATLSGTLRLVVAEDLRVQTFGSTSAGSGAASVALFSLPDLSDGVLEAGTYAIDFAASVDVDSRTAPNASASLTWELVVVPTPATSLVLASLAALARRRRR